MSDKNLEAHLFICTNEKKNGECCGAKGGADLRSKVKELAKRPEWKGKVRINASGCLGHCENGITAVLYPSSQWFTNLSNDDDQVLISAVETLLKGK